MSSLPLHSSVHPTPKPIKTSNRSHKNHPILVSSSLSPIPHLNHTLKSYSLMLQSSTSDGSLLNGKSIHARLIRTGIDPDTHLFDCLINFYSKHRRVGYARKLFDEMPERDVVAYTALMTGYALDCDGRESVRMFCEMHEEEIRANGFVLAACLRACALCLDFDFGQQVHGLVIKLQALSDIFVGSLLVDLYVKCGEAGLAEKVFFGLPLHNEVSLNTLLNGFARNGDEVRVLRFFRHLVDSGMGMNKFTLSIVLKSCVRIGDERFGRAIHSLLIKIGLEIDKVLGSNLIDLYSKCGMALDAHKVFLKIKDPDVVIWSVMISCFDKQGLYFEAIEIFIKMCRIGVSPNEFTLASLARAASELGNRRFCGNIHSYIVKRGFEMENILGNIVLDMYMKCGSIQDSCMVFNAMKGHDTISWNTLLSGFQNGGCYEEGLGIFSQMLIENHIPNKYTFVAVLRSCTALIEQSYGAQVHAHILKNNPETDSFIGKALVDFYATCGDFNYACLIFDNLKDRDVFTWTTIITGFTKKDEGEKALESYRQMQREGITPNESTLAICLRACSNLASLESGSQFHSYAMKSGINNTFMTSALVDMYFKCGCLKEAEAVFCSLSPKDVISWNTIICGYSQHGHGKNALEAFESMIKENKWPDEITFIGVLSACSHEKLLDEGKKRFDSMTNIYGVAPTIEHYACMVDILSRAGMLDEAEQFIDRMKIPPNALIWQTILSACKMHRNLKLGEKAAEKLLELEPYTDSHYVLLSNLYAEFKMWGEVARIRAIMKTRGVKKEPGCSWIQVNGQVHFFLAQDFSHPMAKEISSKVKEFTHEITLAGYTPNIEHVMQNMDDVGEKREPLLP